ncbi:MAG: NAD(P)/FAD-dependent oxidoreductase [Chloroherpetonaceae bacterium]|nr:FAD-dependent oxidoreductase [Chthonomonadaceae bacterium]MDW8206478.1 NAD(P)/FAD-dependent oxidoreductase [Chloroherpetonaceae bacterium]
MVQSKQVIVVGAGLSGLCCARTLQRAGVEAHIYEASDGVGGRVRTDTWEGFLLDRGFQVLFTAYPAIREEMDLDALRLQAFTPGAIICRASEKHMLVDPRRAPAHLLAAAMSPLMSVSDKLRAFQLAMTIGKRTVPEIFTMEDQTLGAYLQKSGFSGMFLDQIVRPFFGGIFLERQLETSVRMFAFVFKMLSEGDTAVPEAGMGALGQQLADSLAPGTLHLNSPVEALLWQGERITGIRLQDGTEIIADRVVLATQADVAARLMGREFPVHWRTSTTAYFALPEPLDTGKLLVLFPEAQYINHAVMMSNVAPSYAPPGQHLLSVTLLGQTDLPDEEIVRRITTDLLLSFPEARPDTWRLLRIYRIPWAQFAQPAGIWEQLPDADTGIPGLILAGEITQSSSLHGALTAGRVAAQRAMA